MDFIQVAQTFEQLFVMMRTSSRLTLFDAAHCPLTTVSKFRPNNCCARAALLTISSFEIDVAFRMMMLTGFRNIYSDFYTYEVTVVVTVDKLVNFTSCKRMMLRWL